MEVIEVMEVTGPINSFQRHSVTFITFITSFSRALRD